MADVSQGRRVDLDSAEDLQAKNPVKFWTIITVTLIVIVALMFVPEIGHMLKGR